jgi:hypothetical protein
MCGYVSSICFLMVVPGDVEFMALMGCEHS